MKIKENYVLQELVDEYIVVPVGEEADYLHGVIRLNETGAFLWKKLSENEQTEEDLIKAIGEKYAVCADTAREDINAFIASISDLDCFE